jgi:helicase
VVIGIGRYQDNRIPPLACSVADARGIHAILTGKANGFIRPENTRLLLEGEATRRSIADAIGTFLPERVKEEDTVIIYFAGHGAPEGGDTFWVPHDADIDRLHATALSNDRISALLKRIPTRRLICFFDTCYSAATINRSWHTRSLIHTDPFEAFKGEGRVVITSSNGRQQSLESREFGHGLFTYYLMEGLRGKADQNSDGYVVLDEVWDYVKNQVTEAASQYGHHQTPIIDGRHSAGILLSRCGPASAGKPSPPPPRE